MTREEYKAEQQERAKKYAAAVAELTAAAVAFEKATANFAAAMPKGGCAEIVKARRAVIGTVYKCVANVRGVPVDCVSICVSPPRTRPA